MRTLLTYYRSILLGIVLAVLPGLSFSQTVRELKIMRDDLKAEISASTDDSLLAYKNYELANVYIQLKDYPNAVQAYGAAALHAKQCNNNNLQLEAYIHRGDKNQLLGENSDAIKDYLSARKVVDKMYEEAMSPVQLTVCKKLEADIYRQIAMVYFPLKHYDKAIDNFSAAKDRYQDIGANGDVAQMLSYLAMCNASKGAYDEAIEYYESLLAEYKKMDDWPNTKSIYQRIAQLYAAKGDYQKLYDINFELYDLTTKNDNVREQSNALNNLAYSLVCKGEYDEAIQRYSQLETNLDTLHKSKKDAEKLLASTYTNLGLCYHNTNRIDESIKYLKKAIELHNRHSQDKEAAQVANLLARIYYLHDELHNAEFYQQMAEDYAIKSEDRNIIKQTYKNFNDILTKKEDYNHALVYYQKYLDLENEEKDSREKESARLATELKSLTDAERTFSEVLNEQEVAALNEERKKVEEQAALELAAQKQEMLQQALLAAHIQDSIQKQIIKEQDAKLLAQAEAMEQQKRADSLTKEQARLAREKADQERQQKEEAERYERNLKDQQEQADRFKNILILAIGIVLFFIIFMISLRRKNKKLKEQQAEIELKNADLIMKNEEITVQKENLQAANNEILTKNEELSRQKEVIEAANKSITDSIVYAKRIQTAVSPSPNFLNMFNFEYFLFFRPRDIVSGDYYWFHADDYNHIFICAADCTGHGVPGAFMSMLGLSLFNKIVAERNILEPDEILNHLRTEVKAALHQEDVNAKQKDGMDLSLVRYDVDTQMLHFAAANNNGYLVQHFSKDEEEKAKANLLKPEHLRETEDGYLRLTIMPADSMPIGVYIREKESFTKTSYQLKAGDSFYLTSDGYIDQFGGKWGRKFLTKNFQQLVMNINEHDMKTQEKIVIETHDNWIGGEYEQLDDIIVIGVRV